MASVFTNSSKSKFDQKCYICFSKSHHSENCPDQAVLSMFPPNIDKDLLPRFTKLLKMEEKYFMALSYPTFYEIIQPKPLKILFKEELRFPSDDNLSNVNLAIAGRTLIVDYEPGQIILPYIIVGFHIEKIQIKNSILLSSEFLQLLSPKTRTVICGGVEFRRNLNFGDIIEKAPNVEILDLCDTNFQADDSWADSLLIDSNCLKSLNLRIPGLNFNIDSLAALMKKKSTTSFIYFLYIIVSKSSKKSDEKEVYEMAEQLLSKHFVPVNDGSQQCFRFSFTCNPKYESCFGHQDYELKNC